MILGKTMARRIPTLAVSSRSALLFVGVAWLHGCASAPPPTESPLDADPPLVDQPASAAKANPALDRGLALVKAGKFAEAEPHLQEALSVDPSRADAAFYLAVCHEEAGRPAEAEKLYLQALERDPSLAEAAQNLAALYLGEPARPDEAVKLLERALQKAPGDPKLLANLGYAHGLRGDVPAASKAYEAALAKEPTAQLQFAYGVMLFENKKHAEAVPVLRKAAEGIDDLPTLATIARMMGPGKAFGDCVKLLDRVLEAKGAPTGAGAAELHVRRGVCKHELKDEKAASADFERAIKLDPKFAAAHYYLGLSKLAQADRLGARSSLRKASELGAEGPIGKQAKAKLAELGWK